MITILGLTFGLWNCIMLLFFVSIGLHILAFVSLKVLVAKLNI